MARTIREIYDSLVAEKESMSSLRDLAPSIDSSQKLLSDIQSTSKVADWRLWLWIVAFGMYTLEALLDAFRTEIDAKVLGAKAHNLRWYWKQALAFQLGYDLVYNENQENYQYDQVDTDAQIITRSATEESQGRVIVKVATDTGALTSGEMDAFSAYMSKMKDAGTDLLLVSTTPDEFKIELEVYYNPMVLNPDGSLILDSNTKPIEDQITLYRTSLEFNGAFNRNAFIDSLQKSEGVVDPVLIDLQIKSSIAAYAQVPIEYAPYSGYYTWDEANSSITYIPKNV